MFALDDICWIFICQSGVIEREACLLAASLRNQLGETARLIAAVPQPETVMGRNSAESVSFLKSIGVELRELFNPLPENSNQTAHLMMNKAYALDLAPDAEVTVYLDSDQLCHGPVRLADFAVPFFGRRASYKGARWMDGLWDRAFQLCGATMPNQRLVSISRRDPETFTVSPPYFNAGFLSVHRAWIHELKAEYIDCFKRLWDHNLLGKGRYYTEQAAVTIAVAKINVPYQIDTWRIDQSFFHYEKKQRLFGAAEMMQHVVELCDRLPELRRALSGGSEWAPICRG